MRGREARNYSNPVLLGKWKDVRIIAEFGDRAPVVLSDIFSEATKRLPAYS
jgi:hypothetical protein